MIKNLPKMPSTKRHFANCWGELDYVCKKMRYWLYTRKSKSRAERYLERLASILRKLPGNDMAIIREEGLALFHELKGQRSDAIIHREREIHLMETLHKVARSARYAPSTRTFMLQDREEAELQERRGILENLRKQESQMHAPLRRVLANGPKV